MDVHTPVAHARRICGRASHPGHCKHVLPLILWIHGSCMRSACSRDLDSRLSVRAEQVAARPVRTRTRPAGERNNSDGRSPARPTRRDPSAACVASTSLWLAASTPLLFLLLLSARHPEPRARRVAAIRMSDFESDAFIDDDSESDAYGASPPKKAKAASKPKAAVRLTRTHRAAASARQPCGGVRARQVPSAPVGLVDPRSCKPPAVEKASSWS